jgi:hypothetical protein
MYYRQQMFVPRAMLLSCKTRVLLLGSGVRRFEFTIHVYPYET